MYIHEQIERRRTAVMHRLRQLRQDGTTADYTRAFYKALRGGTPGITEDTLKEVYVLGLSSPHLRLTLMQMPLRHMDLWDITDRACDLAMDLEY